MCGSFWRPTRTEVQLRFQSESQPGWPSRASNPTGEGQGSAQEGDGRRASAQSRESCASGAHCPQHVALQRTRRHLGLTAAAALAHQDAARGATARGVAPRAKAQARVLPEPPQRDLLRLGRHAVPHELDQEPLEGAASLAKSI